MAQLVGRLGDRGGAAPADATVALMYHALGVPTGPGADPHYTVDLPRFRAQIALCQRTGGGAVSARDWLAGHAGVIITFDDGHETNYQLGLPALLELGASADFFVNPRQVGTPGFATWAQLREMADAGMSIQSHGFDHSYYLTALVPERLREDLRRSREVIEDRVGHAVTLLAPPGGRSPAHLAEIAQECGYTHVLDSRPGWAVRGQRTLCRMAITAGADLAWLEAGGAVAIGRARLRYSILDLAKRALGDRRYETMRSLLLGGSSP